MRYQILSTAESDDLVFKQLEEKCDIEYAGWKTESRVFPEDELIARLKGKDIFITSYDKVTRKVIEASKGLKLIACTRANPVNVDTQAAKENGIAVVYTPGRNSDITAEFAVGLLLDIARNITVSNRAIMDGTVVMHDTPTEPKKDVTWGEVRGNRPYHLFQGVQIKNKNVGIIGYGSIGRRVGKILSGFGANILVYDPYVSRIEIDAPGFKKVDLNTLLSESDFISCHIKITEETTNLLNKDAFAKMKKTAYIINNSRGAIINEDDLLVALKQGDIGGAALDVFNYEPLYDEHPFIKSKLNNLLLTPHISGACPDAITNGSLLIVDEINEFLLSQE